MGGRSRWRQAVRLAPFPQPSAIQKWNGQTVVILASGPSLTQEDAAHARGKAKVIACNNCYALAPWADMLYACDYRWWKHYRPDFYGLKVCPHPGGAKEFGLIYIKGEHKPGLSFDPQCIHYGGNSGFQAFNLAVLSGAKRIILLGFDMQPAANGRLHWHQDHRNIGNPQRNSFGRWIKAFSEAAPQLAERGISVLNCSRETALTMFERTTIEAAL